MAELVDAHDSNSCSFGVPVRFRSRVQSLSLIREAFFVMYIVYAISSLDANYIYVGLTSNLEDRLNRHNNGYEKTTKFYAPFELIFTEACENRQEARKREKYWKSGIGKEKLRKLRDHKSK